MFSKTEIVHINPSTVKDFDMGYLINKYVKFDSVGWTKVVSVKVLRLPDNTEIVLHVNGSTSKRIGVKPDFLSEANPRLEVRNHRWLPW